LLCLRNARAFPLLPAALASVSFGFVLVRVRVVVITYMAVLRLCFFLSPPPEGGMDLVTSRQDAISSASTESPGPDWKPGFLIRRVGDMYLLNL